MLLDEKINDLQNFTKKKITYDKVANVLGLGSKQAAYNRITRKQPLKQWEINALDKAFGMSLENDNSENTITIDYYPEVFGSCGTGYFVTSEVKEQIKVPANIFIKKISPTKKYSLINAKGDSMQPFIYSGDKLVVEHWNGEQIIDNEVYVFCYKDEIFIKRLTKNVNQIIIKSDNKEYDTVKLTDNELNNIQIVGQIVGLMRDLR